MDDKIIDGVSVVDEYSKWLYIWFTMDRVEEESPIAESYPTSLRFYNEFADKVRLEVLNKLGWRALPKSKVQGFLDNFDRKVQQKLNELDEEAERSGEKSVEELLVKYARFPVDFDDPEVISMAKIFEENQYKDSIIDDPAEIPFDLDVGAEDGVTDVMTDAQDTKPRRGTLRRRLFRFLRHVRSGK